MSVLTFTLILLLGAYCAGLLGSLTGLGGGVVIIPLLTLCFGVDFHYAVGAALVSSVATSSGSGSAYVKEGITNIRLGMVLEIATTLGAVAGAVVAVWLNNSVISIIYGGVLVLTAVMQQVKHDRHEHVVGSPLARRLKLFGTFPQKDGSRQYYELTHVGGGFSVMLLAGDCDGWLYESTVQGEHHHVQLYDGRDGLRFGGGLHSARQHSARPRFSGAHRGAFRSAHRCQTTQTVGRVAAAQNLCLCHPCRGGQYDLHGLHGWL